MTIDGIMLGAVRHYLMGMVATTGSIHSEIHETGRSFDYVISKDGRTLGNDVDSAKQAFLRDCREMLKDPVPKQYAHIENYHLKPDDRSFLTELCRMAEETNWRNDEGVTKLGTYIDAYAPHSGFKSGIQSQ